MLSAGISDALLPDVSACSIFNDEGKDVMYNFGPDTHLSSPAELIKVCPEVLFEKMSKNRVITKKKRTAPQTPQKGARSKIRPKMSTPKKISYQ